jgi:hypothetical protein
VPHRASRLKSVLKASKRTAHQAQKSFLLAEDTLTALEERESKRAERADRAKAEVARRLPAIGGDH